MRTEVYDQILFDKLTLNKATKDVAQANRVSEATVKNVVASFEAARNGEAGLVEAVQRGRRPGMPMIDWAAERAGITLSAESREMMERLQKAQKEKSVPRKKEEPAPNDAIAVVRELESLKALIQGQAALLDAITNGQNELLDALKALAGDLKDNNNANADLVCQRLKECGDTLSGIKMNTRKKGL